MGEVSLCLSWHTDWYAAWPTCAIYQVRSFDLTSGQIFQVTFGSQKAYLSMRPDAKNTMVFAFCLIFLVQKSFEKNVDITKKQHFLFDLPWVCQNVAYSNMFSIRNFVAKLYCNKGQMNWGGTPPPQVRSLKNMYKRSSSNINTRDVCRIACTSTICCLIPYMWMKCFTWHFCSVTVAVPLNSLNINII